MKKLLLPLFIVLGFFSCSLIVNAQGYAVKPINDILSEYKDKHQVILDNIQKRTDLAHAQKYVLYQHEITNLKEAFKANRIAEYESKSVQLSVQRACTGESGGLKDCGSACVSAPSSDLYTQNDWIKIVGATKGTSVSTTDSTACLRMTVMGKGRNTGTLYATFRYRPASILALTEKETNYLFTSLNSFIPEYLK
jgi:L-rhamnose mutarotase